MQSSRVGPTVADIVHSDAMPDARSPGTTVPARPGTRVTLNGQDVTDELGSQTIAGEAFAVLP